MRLTLLTCTECDQEVEVINDGDGPMMCSECLSVDCFKEAEEEEV